MTKLQKIDFMFELAFNKKLPDFYDKAQNKSNTEIIIKKQTSELPDLSDSIYMVCDVPSFLHVSIKPTATSKGLKSVIQHKGYCVDFEGYTDIESYIKDRFKSKKSKRVLRTGKKRLETCFNITYKMYYGNIDQMECDKLFKRFYKLLELRAIEKGIVNRNLKDWEIYSSRAYDLIMNKQASLFVIYDNTKAINISMHLHVKNTAFLYMAAYDIDYSKFRLGHTNIMMILDWFLNNGIKLADFSKGNVGYKKQWANIEYDFEYHLFFDSSRIASNFKTYLISSKLRLLQYLRDKNINTYYYNTLSWLRGNKKLNRMKNYRIEIENELPSTAQQIEYRNNVNYDFLKRIVYNYLYVASLNVKKLMVYDDTQSSQLYFLKGPKELVKITLLN